MIEVPESSEKYYYEIMTEKSKTEIVHFLNHNFRFDEPLNRACQITEKEVNSCLSGAIHRALLNPISILARSKYDHEIVGCMLNSLWTRNGSQVENTPENNEFDFATSRNSVQAMGEILNELHNSFWRLEPHHNSVIHFEISSVNKNHTRQGIASTFLKWTENSQLLNSVQATGIVAEATSLANQMLLDRRGYKTIGKIELESKFDLVTGKPWLVCDDGTTDVRLMFKDFRANF